MILLPVAHSFHSMEPGTMRLISTELHNSQKKKPRFSQQAHIRSTKKLISKKKPQPWDSGKSIDDLESTLVSRWGTLDDPSASDKKSSSSSDLRMPVLDPWQEDKKKKKPIIREYYDEDDEGFEYIELGEDEEIDDDAIYEDDVVLSGREKKHGSIKMKVGHLISPKPVGGRGTNQLDDGPATDSYFFNPKSTPAEKKSNENQKTAETTASTQTKTPDPVHVVEPLLDENGKPLLLTLEEARRRFESTVGDNVLDAIDSTEESPIVALAKSQSWEDLGITSPILLENLKSINCPTPLDVQVKSIPPAMTGNDVLIGTYTGSGKTLSFLTPLVQRLLWNDDVEKLGLAILIIAPGRELASQITSVTRELIQDTGLTVQLAIGGTTFTRNLEQIRKRKPNILVGTPGRLAELVVGKPGEK
jgi:primosomal protein N'